MIGQLVLNNIGALPSSVYVNYRTLLLAPAQRGWTAESVTLYDLTGKDTPQWTSSDIPPETYGSDVVQVKSKTVNAWTMYCVSSEVDDKVMYDEDSSYLDKKAYLDARDKRGDGSKDNPFRDLSYALEVLSCYMDIAVDNASQTTCKFCENTYFRLSVSGKINRPPAIWRSDRVSPNHLHDKREKWNIYAFDGGNRTIVDFTDADVCLSALDPSSSRYVPFLFSRCYIYNLTMDISKSPTMIGDYGEYGEGGWYNNSNWGSCVYYNVKLLAKLPVKYSTWLEGHSCYKCECIYTGHAENENIGNNVSYRCNFALDVSNPYGVISYGPNGVMYAKNCTARDLSVKSAYNCFGGDIGTHIGTSNKLTASRISVYSNSCVCNSVIERGIYRNKYTELPEGYAASDPVLHSYALCINCKFTNCLLSTRSYAKVYYCTFSGYYHRSGISDGFLGTPSSYGLVISNCSIKITGDDDDYITAIFRIRESTITDCSISIEMSLKLGSIQYAYVVESCDNSLFKNVSVSININWTGSGDKRIRGCGFSNYGAKYTNCSGYTLCEGKNYWGDEDCDTWDNCDI